MLSAEFRRSVGEVIHRGVPLLFGCGYALRIVSIMPVVVKIGILSEFGKIGFTRLPSKADKTGRTHTAME